jgi:hypothetical protein
VKSTKVQLQQRLEQVMQWQHDSVPSYEIVKRAIKAWGVQQRQAWGYIAECNKIWESQFKEDLQALKHKLQARLESLYSKMDASGDYRGAADAAKKLADISGVTKQAVEVSGKDGGPIETKGQVQVLFLPQPEDAPA